MLPIDDLIQTASDHVREKLHIMIPVFDEISLIQIYQFLHSLYGGDLDLMNHWMHTNNKHLGFVPCERLSDEEGITLILDYLYSFIL